MDIRRAGEHLELSDVDPFLAELLRQVPESTDPGSYTAANERLFSKPSGDETLCSEWKSYVEPELHRLFQTSTETVAGDLAQLNGESKPFRNCRLRIPLSHTDAWLNTLNQARLVIAAKYNFSDGELGEHYRSPIGSRRDLALFQVNFYGFLQECLLRETGA